MIDDTYLVLKGWEAYLFDIDGQMAYVMSNPALNVIINQRGIIRNDSITVCIEDLRYVSRVKYSEVWPHLMDEVYKFDKGMSTVVDIV